MSVILPEIVIGTIFPLGGHITFGAAERVITGGVVSTGAVLFSNTPSEVFEQGGAVLHRFVTSRSGLPSPFTSADATELAPP